MAKKIGSETLTENTGKPESQDEPADDKKPDEAAPQVAVAPGVKRSANGRFMDVVHPSSDMRSAASSSPSVSARTVSPLSVGAPVASDSEDHGSLTPFLPDANEKVEKRPLGGAASPFSDETGDDKKPESDEAGRKDADEQEPIVIETSSINSEGHAEIDKSGDLQQTIDATEIIESSPEEKRLLEIESKEEIEPDFSVAEPKIDTIEMVESGDTEHLRGKSDKDNHHGKKGEKADAILGTEEFHQPLAHPKKQKSGWGKVLVIVLIIIIFAAAGGAAYLLLG
jgi:hypothetical protein